MAIKGKTKRSQARAVQRRPAAGPRVHLVERRQVWYRAPVFAVTLAVVALAVTVVAATVRVQEAWRRDDVRRFTELVRGPIDNVTAITTGGSGKNPGFGSVDELTSGKLEPDELAKRAQTWYDQLLSFSSAMSGITLGRLTPDELDGTPSNGVGGRVPELDTVRDQYIAAIETYAQAAKVYRLAGQAPKGSQLAKDLIAAGKELEATADKGMDAAAELLARLNDRYDLDVQRQMPGESTVQYSNRYTGAGTAPMDTTPLPTETSAPTQTSAPPTTEASEATREGGGG